MGVKPTSIRLVVVLAVIGAALGWALATVVAGWTGRSLPLPILAGSALWLLAIALFTWGWFVRPRVRARNEQMPQAEPMPALMAARIVVLTMAASRMGAVVAGFYLGAVIATVAEGMTTPASQQTVWSGVLAATGAAVTCAAALWIERACLLPAQQDDDE
jgi:hypothetical protein